MRKRGLSAVAAGAALSLTLAACGGGGGQSGGTGSGAEFNSADGAIVNESDRTGGTLKLATEQDFDSPDPGNTYYAWTQNFIRNYGRTMTTFKKAPGEGSLEVVPDLAEGLGEFGEDGKTVTYQLKQGLKFDDGTEITSKDVKYAIARTYDREVMQNGPDYFSLFIDNGGKKYKGPYKDKDKEMKNLSGIETPDDHTITFKLTQPFTDFDYLMTFSQTVPVPQDKDTGAKYLNEIVSSGPYKIDSYEPGKGMKLSKNEHWDPATDPNRSRLVDNIELQIGVQQDDVDQRLMSGALHLDARAIGVGTAAQGKILGNPQEKRNADNPYGGFTWFFTVNQTVKPFDNIDCRKAVQYAVNKVDLQTAFGGPIAGGDIATTLMPPSVKGHEQFNLYETPDHKGDPAKAKEHLEACGQPDGFKTKISARSDRDKEMKAAEALQQSLKKAGIDAQIKSFPSDRYFTNAAGAPAFVKKEEIGLSFHGWHADWPTGYGFLQQIVDSRTIKPQGNTNVMELESPEIDKKLDESVASQDDAEREKLWAEVDRLTMESATVVPYLYGKILLYRNPDLTNVFVDYAYGEYNYANLGLSK